MTDLSYQQMLHREKSAFNIDSMRTLVLVLLALVAAGIGVMLASTFYTLPLDDPMLLDSTVGELAVWTADESARDAPVSLFGQYAQNWAHQLDEESLDAAILLTAARNGLFIWCSLIVVLILLGTTGIAVNHRWSRPVLLLALVGLNALLFIVPPATGANLLALVLVGITLLLVMLAFAPGRVTKILGFVVVFSSLLVGWQVMKAFADSIDYSVTLPLPAWNYTAYDDNDAALEALRAGEITVVIGERRDLAELTPPYPEGGTDPAELPYPDLRYLPNIVRESSQFSFPLRPVFPGRLTAVVRDDEAAQWTNTNQFLDRDVGTIAGTFADESYLALPRNLVLVDLRIFNDLNLPHLQSIAEAFFQPARRNGPVLLARILAEAGLYTWGEALFGFAFGATLGFLLGTLFAHSRLMERGLLPYVVASQTVPIIAIAPMVVIWLGAGPLAVSVISAYLTFFPVTINTLRGLTSPNPTSLELMQSYAASRWTIMWKLRLPAALPYIFTALKISATASVVGAIIGELPSSIRSGLGRIILDFSSDYSLISTPKLWATIITAATVGMFFFLLVSLVERVVLRGYVRNE